MKLKNILSIPFAVVADIASLGNMGGRSFTQQVMDKDREEQAVDDLCKIIKSIKDADKQERG